jgi:hypothetical protein
MKLMCRFSDFHISLIRQVLISHLQYMYLTFTFMRPLYFYFKNFCEPPYQALFSIATECNLW